MLSINVKRILSLLLVAVMLLGQCPITVLATYDTETTVTESVDMEITASGVTDPFTSYQEQINAIVMKYLGKSQADQDEIWAAVEPMDFETYQTVRWEINSLLDEIIEAGKSGILSEERIQQFENENETFLNFYLALEEKNDTDENGASFLAGSYSGTLAVTGGNLGLSGSWDTTTIAGVTKNYGNVSVSGSGTSATITIQSDRKGKTTTATLTNNAGDTKELCFTYTTSSGTVTFPSDATAVDGSFSMVMTNGQTISITFTPSNYSEGTVEFSNIELKTVESGYDVTVTTTGSGTVTADQTITNGVISAVSPIDGVTLTATPGTGATFLGWINPDTKLVLSTSASYLLKPSAETSIQAVFAHPDADAWFQVGGLYLFNDLNKAGTTAAGLSDKTVVLMNNATLPAGDYTIPSGVTLLIPFDSANTMYTTNHKDADGLVTNAMSSATSKPSGIYRTLTMSDGAKITVNGTINLSAKLNAASGGDLNAGTPYGDVPIIKMQGSSNITLNSGAYLYSYGYITGSGSVTVKNGATVYEPFQLRDFRGGSTSSGAKHYFPVSQYYIQNVEVPITFASGAKLKGVSAINVGVVGNVYMTDIAVVGTSDCLFSNSGSVTLKYDGTADRLIVDIYGAATMSSIELSMGNLGMSIDSAKFVLGLNNNITVNINSGKTTLNQEMALQAGSVINIANGAELALAKDLYVYDQDEWGEFVFSHKASSVGIESENESYKSVLDTANNVAAIPIGYAPGKNYSRTWADLVDAKIDVNGTLTATSANLYTTPGGANICSSEGTGKVTLTPGTESITYQLDVKAGGDYDYFEIPITSAQLKNGDGTYVQSATDTYTYFEGFWHTSECTTKEYWTSEKCTCGHQAVAAVITENISDGTTTMNYDYHGTLTATVDAYISNTGYIQMLTGTTETTVGDAEETKNIYLDLNGQKVEVTTFHVGTLYGMDTGTDAFLANEGDKAGSIVGNVTIAPVASHQLGGTTEKHYVPIQTTDDDGVTTTQFHRVASSISAVQFYLVQEEGETQTAYLTMEGTFRSTAAGLGALEDLGFAVDGANNMYVGTHTDENGQSVDYKIADIKDDPNLAVGYSEPIYYTCKVDLTTVIQSRMSFGGKEALGTRHENILNVVLTEALKAFDTNGDAADSTKYQVVYDYLNLGSTGGGSEG